LIGALLIGLAGTAQANGFTALTSNAKYVAPMPDGAGVFVEGTTGYFIPWTFDGTNWHRQVVAPNAPAVNGRGLSVVYDDANHYTYLFEIEDSGLWYIRTADDGKTWDNWCPVDGRTDLISAPSAVFLGLGYGFHVYARDSQWRLVDWTIDPGSGYCSSYGSRVIGSTAIAPVAVSWGHGRVDVFGSNPIAPDHGLLEHFWSNDGTHYGSESSFTLSGTEASFPMFAASQNLAATSPGTGLLEVVFQDGVHVSHLGYANNYGWYYSLLGSASDNPLVTISPVYSYSYPYGEQASASIFGNVNGARAIRINFGAPTAPISLAPLPPNPATQIASIQMSKSTIHIVFAIAGSFLYWTQGGDGT